MPTTANRVSVPSCKMPATSTAGACSKTGVKGRRIPTSRRKKARAAREVPPSPPRPGPEGLRRGLLGLVTALIVARPLVAGEDPGLLAPLSSTSNLVLTLLWIVAVLGWAVWRAWSGDGAWYGSLVEVGLFGVVAAAFVSAGTVAAYKHPA